MWSQEIFLHGPRPEKNLGCIHHQRLRNGSGHRQVDGNASRAGRGGASWRISWGAPPPQGSSRWLHVRHHTEGGSRVGGWKVFSSSQEPIAPLKNIPTRSRAPGV